MSDSYTEEVTDILESENRKLRDQLADLSKANQLLHALLSNREDGLASAREQLDKARKALNEIFRYSHEQYIVDLALKARNELGALTDDFGSSQKTAKGKQE